MDLVVAPTRDAAHHDGRRGLRRGVTAATATALVVGMLPLLAPGATAIEPQPETTWETGVISGIADGDTVSVDIDSAADPQFIAPANPSARSYCDERVNPDGTMPADGDLDRCRIRLIGIQAPEKAGASGGSALEQCRASSATQALAAVLPRGTRVQLRSISVRSTEDNYSGGRLARTVYYEATPGTWVDAGRAVLGGGHAMWFPHSLGDAEKPEYAHNLEYRRLVDAAAAARRGLWSAGYCGSSAPAAVRTWVVSDPIGDDAGNEYMVVKNDSAAPLDVSGWTVRDSSLTTFTFPAGTTIGARDHLRVFTGSGAPGTPTARDFHFNGPSQMFVNWDPTAGYFHGDAAYVYDPQPGYAYGNLRAWFHYPCDGASCTDPLVGRIRFGAISYNPPGADTAAGEYVEVVNTTAAPVPLGGYAFTRRGSQFPFPAGTVLAPGATLRVSVGTGTDDASTVHMGRTSSLLTNTGDLLALANLNHAPVDCRAWGGYSCAGQPVSGPLQQPGESPTPAPAPPPAPVTTTPATTSPVATSTRPGAPDSVRVKKSKRRLVVRWAAPAPNGSAAVKKYRAKVYRVKANGKLKYRAKCYAKASKLKCRTKKLTRRTTYVVKVQARNRKGYGPASALVTYRLK
jgi:endonuclease YncB( thermonuclease family)